jgi:hypothetical protein
MKYKPRRLRREALVMSLTRRRPATPGYARLLAKRRRVIENRMQIVRNRIDRKREGK